MQRIGFALALVATLLLGAVLLPASVAAQDGGEQPTSTVHVVQPGESLFDISRQYGVSVNVIQDANNITDVNVISVGASLVIPGAQPANPPQQDDGTETPLPPDDDTIIHVVQPGENLFRIAQLYGTTIQEIIRLNNLSDPNDLVVGQELIIDGTPVATTPPPAATTPAPEATETEPTATETETPSATTPAPEATTPAATEGEGDTPTATVPATDETAEFGFAYGVELSLNVEDAGAVVNSTTDLGVEWVKHVIDWSVYEPTQGQIDFDTLDTLIETLEASDANILLTVVGAPVWARAVDSPNSAPQNYNAYGNFVGALAERYGTRVAAYQVWSRPNLGEFWEGKPVNGTEYVSLLQAAYTAIKAANPEAVVVSAGLSPTGGGTDALGRVAVNDVQFLREMYNAGLSVVSDAIGAQPFSAANPPDSTCCENDPSITRFNNDRSFFFLDTLNEYRTVMEEFGDGDTLIWVTEFGWGSNQNSPIQPDPSFAFVEDVTLDQQAAYLVRGFTLGRSLGFVGPMFASNLNYCQDQVLGATAYQCFYSFLDPFGGPRPVFSILRDTITAETGN